MEHLIPSVSDRFLRQLQEVCAASKEYLDANLELQDLVLRLEDFAALDVWPCIPASTSCSPQSATVREPLPDIEDDLQRALFYTQAGLYQDAKERLRRFLRYALWQAAIANGAEVERREDETMALAALLAEDGFRTIGEALSLRSRLEQWRANIEKPDPQLAVSCTRFYPSSLRTLVACAHEAINLAIACCVYRKPQIMVALEGTDTFGDYVLWAGLLEHDEVEVVHRILKPETRKGLLAYVEGHPTVSALRQYLRTAKPVTSEDEFEPRFNEMIACVSHLASARSAEREGA